SSPLGRHDATRWPDPRPACPCSRRPLLIACVPGGPTMPRTLGALLFDDFELLDLFGPLEMFGNMQGAVRVLTVADRAGLVRSAQGPRVQADHGLDDCPPLDLLLIPGGIGTQAQVESRRAIDWLRARVAELEVAMTVCTGTALLAQAGLLDGRRA